MVPTRRKTFLQKIPRLMDSRIIIVSPSYNPQIGGAIVLHKLCDILNNLGIDSSLTTTQKLNGSSDYFMLNSDFNTKIAEDIDLQKDIIIYPEIERGNPFGAKNVVRYILSKSHLVNIKGGSHSYTWGSNDFWLYFHDLFYDNIKEKNILHIIHPKTQLYYDMKVLRDVESCFTYRKSPIPKQKIHDDNSIEIHYNTPDSELVNIFNKCKKFYSYDTETYLNVLASLCGCESIIIPQEGKSKEEIIKNQPSFKYGIAYGLDDSQYAKDTQHLVKSHLENLEQTQINDTFHMFQKIKNHFTL
jgi:hypothetical protein